MKESWNTYEVDLVSLVKAMLRKWWLILLPALICAVLMFCYAAFYVTPMYQSTAVMYINASASSNIDINGLNTARDLVSTYSYLVKNARGTLEEVAEKTGLNYSYEQLRSMVSVSGGADTEFLEIKVRSSDAQVACLIANTIMDVLPGRAAATNLNSTIHPTAYAVVAEHPTSTGEKQSALIGFVIGALIGMVTVMLSEMLNDTIQSEDWLKQTFNEDIPLLSVIPSADRSKRSIGRYYSYYQHYSASVEQDKKHE